MSEWSSLDHFSSLWEPFEFGMNFECKNYVNCCELCLKNTHLVREIEWKELYCTVCTSRAVYYYRMYRRFLLYIL